MGIGTEFAVYFQHGSLSVLKRYKGVNWSLNHKYCQAVIRGQWWPVQDGVTSTSPCAVCAHRYVSVSILLLPAWLRGRLLTFKLPVSVLTCIMYAVCVHYPGWEGSSQEMLVKHSLLLPSSWLTSMLENRRPDSIIKHKLADSPSSRTGYGLDFKAYINNNYSAPLTENSISLSDTERRTGWCETSSMGCFLLLFFSFLMRLKSR